MKDRIYLGAIKDPPFLLLGARIPIEITSDKYNAAAYHGTRLLLRGRKNGAWHEKRDSRHDIYWPSMALSLFNRHVNSHLCIRLAKVAFGYDATWGCLHYDVEDDKWFLRFGNSLYRDAISVNHYLKDDERRCETDVLAALTMHFFGKETPCPV